MLRPSSLLALLLLSAVAGAQRDVTVQNIPALDAEGDDVRETVRRLFLLIGMPYSIAVDVQGTVNARLRNVPFETALQNVLRQVDATYRIGDGVYQIVRREDAGPPAFFACQPDIDRAYVRLRDLAPQPRKFAAWVDPNFVLFTSGRMRKGADALRGLAEVEKGYRKRTASVEAAEPPVSRRAPGVDEYATVRVTYEGLESRVVFDTWRCPAGGAWRLVARRDR